MANTKGAEERYGRREATKSLNSWGREGRWTVSPVTNIVGIVNAVRQKMQQVKQMGPTARAAIEALERALSPIWDRYLQESGKPDLFACIHTDDHLPIAMAVEVKGMCGKLERDTLRENQIAWARAGMWYEAYYIFLWAYEDDDLPKNFQSAAERAKRHAYLIPLEDWLTIWNHIEGKAQVKTIRFNNGPRSRKALRENGITIHTMFGRFELVREGSNWALPAKHPFYRKINQRSPLPTE